MTLSFRSLLTFCPVSWEYWNGVKTKTRKFFGFFFFCYHFVIAFAIYVNFVVFLQKYSRRSLACAPSHPRQPLCIVYSAFSDSFGSV